MASIKKQGKGYKITVSKGYDINGKQLREYMTWVPPAGMTPKQAEKEVKRQAVLFEEQVQCNTTHDGNMRLVDFTALFLKDYAYPNLKIRTAFGYEEAEGLKAGAYRLLLRQPAGRRDAVPAAGQVQR